MPATQEDASEPPPLAPLIVVNMSRARTVTLDSVDRTVQTVRVAGRRHEVLDHVWFLSVERGARSVPAVEEYRMLLLLGVDGFPLVARVAESRSDGQDRPSYFVSRSLEDAAIERFGAPLPGRKFAVEASLASAPDFFVAGVFEDGPMPMGPYVYLDPSGLGVVTVLCRCAASQVDDFAMTAHYDLVDDEFGSPSDGEASRVEGNDPFSNITAVLRWPFRVSDAGGSSPKAPR